MTSGYLRGSNNLLAGASAQGGYTIDESLRFNASQSSYLSWTPASTGNRQIMTFSFWMKRGLLTYSANYLNLFTSYPGSSAIDVISFSPSSDSLRVWFNGSASADLITTQVFRDPSAWYHVVVAIDTTQATSSNRIKVYVNGSQITSFSTATYPSQNYNTYWNSSSYASAIGANLNGPQGYFDGYLTEVNFIDGQALDASSFGEFDATTGVWKPKGYTGTYGTNGFYLPMKLDNTVEGFNTVTYVGTGSRQKISGVGFSPDLIWMKSRTSAVSHVLIDSVRGVKGALSSNNTAAEYTESTNNGVLSFDTDGFTVGNDGNYTSYNSAGQNIVAWCWDAGNTTVSNTDGSITSSVRANPTYGFSVVSWTSSGSTSDTVGHGLSSTPKVVIYKNRDAATNWLYYTTQIDGSIDRLLLNTTGAKADVSLPAFTSTTFQNESGTTNNFIAYCFSEVSGYSKFGSYSGTGAAGNVVTTGFKPAFVMIKGSSLVSQWNIVDATRDAVNPADKRLFANLSNAETTGVNVCTFTDTGFTINNSDAGFNQSGSTYIYMAFKDTREYAFWLDDSGNNNDWQPNGGITTSSTVTDTPTPYLGGGNYAVLNPLTRPVGAGGAFTVSEGNLKVAMSYIGADSSIAVSSGKWYWEVQPTSGTAAYNPRIGIVPSNHGTYTGTSVGDGSGTYGYASTGQKGSGGSYSAYGASYTDSDVIGVAFDLDAGSITFYKNGVSQGVAFTGISGEFYASTGSGGNGGGLVLQYNFGQRPFTYTPPTGFKALHTGNLPDSSIVDGSKYFDALLYTGNGSTQSVTGLEFQPDFTWIKSRSSVINHALFDANRGVSRMLQSSTTGAEIYSAGNYLSSFDTDGFTVQGQTAVNHTSSTFVAWNWKANGTGVTNTDGSITSTVSANPTAGFSIVSWTGVGSASNTIGHGLGSPPKFIITKTRTASIAYNWNCYHAGIDATAPEDYFISLNTTSARASYTAANCWDRTQPTSTVFSVNSNAAAGPSGDAMIAYCFAEVESYSKFGSYLGNGSADGPFIYLGFRPAFFMTKCTSTSSDWRIVDGTRDIDNPVVYELNANSSAAETTYSNGIDFNSNGVKIRETVESNTSGATYIYMAFAENPFKNSLAR